MLYEWAPDNSVIQMPRYSTNAESGAPLEMSETDGVLPTQTFYCAEPKVLNARNIHRDYYAHFIPEFLRIIQRIKLRTVTAKTERTFEVL